MTMNGERKRDACHSSLAERNGRWVLYTHRVALPIFNNQLIINVNNQFHCILFILLFLELMYEILYTNITG